MHDEAVSKKHVIYGIAPVLVNNRVTHIIGIRFRSRDIPYLFINPKKNEGVFIVSRDRTTAFGMNDITYTAYNKRTASAILQSDKWASNKDIKKEFHFVWPYIYISAMIKNTQWTIVIEFSIMDILSKLMHQHSFLFILSVPSLILMWAGVLYVATRPQHNTSLLHSIDQDENLLLAGVFHEIRTPLHGALGNLELLRNEVNSPVAVARIDVINNTMSSLMTLTNLFLTQSQAEANKSSLMHEHYDLTALLEQCLQTWAPLITKRNVALYFLADDILDVQIWGDSQQLGQIVLNLLSNAYKFTTHGLIILHTRLTVNKGGDKRLQISVSDTGCGIPEDKQKAVFQPFIKNVAAHPKYTEGTGLGLSICQQLARRMKGEIVLESEIGVGTRFILEIPLEEMSVSPDSSDTRLSGQQVALYCSSRLWEASLTRMLSHWGIQVTPHNIHALSSLQQVDKTVLVASTELPPLSSLTSTGCTVILLTPDGPLAPEISDKFIHLTAFSMTALKTLLQQQFVPKRRISVGEVLTGSSTQSTPRLLVVDDNPVNLALIHQQLRTIGYNNIDLASSGEEALTQLQSSNYALIITDFYMPKLSGEGLVLWLRQQELKTPVIATSAATVNSQEFDAILLKPFSLEQLRTTINRFLPQFDSAPSYSADVFYNDVYRLFSSEWLVERERILSAITQGDKQDFNHLMHRLKGSLLTLGWREHAEFIDTICSNLPTLTHKSWEHCWLMLSASLEHMIKYIG